VTARVLVLDHTAALGGGELALCRTLATLDRSAYAPSVVLFADGPLRPRLEALGVEVAVVPLAPRTARLARTGLAGPAGVHALADTARHAAALRRLVRLRRPDLVVANSLKAGVVGGPVARSAGVPFVWHLRDRLAPDYLPRPVAVTVRHLLRRVSTHVVANSHATLATVGLLPAGRSTVAYSGLLPGDFDPRPRPRRPGPPVVALLGRLSPTKGQHVFLRAAAGVRRCGVEARFRVVGAPLFGEEAYAAGLRPLADRLGIGDDVELVGWADDPLAALAEVDLLVHASPVPEPFGQVVVQAMAARVPVVATDAGGVPEILDPDGAAHREGRVRRSDLGQLVPPGDADALAAAVRWALGHPEESARMADAAWASARERFTTGPATAAVERAWAQALAAGRPPARGPLTRRAR